jgi:hypothetical protein
MPNTLVRVYNRLSDAENARNALVSSGFSPEAIHLESRMDEAGPVEGNFALEYKDSDNDNDVSVFDSLFGRDDPNEGSARSDVAWRGSYVMTIDANDETQLARASDIAKQHGAVDIDDRVANRRDLSRGSA